MIIDTLSSAKNPRIKELASLLKNSSKRRECGLFVVEGVREVDACIKGGYVLESLFFVPDLFSEQKALATGCPHLNIISEDLYSTVAYRGGTEGVIAIVREKRMVIDNIELSENPLVIVLESVEKPGNLGAVLRTADAAGVDAVIVCDPLTDLFNPNLIRSSLGAIFTMQVVACSSEECSLWLKREKILIFTSEVQASEWYYNVDFTMPSALVMGSEADGLSPYWRDNADRRIKIPMKGFVDSLNVSVSAAILCFEAVRQRNSKEDFK